MHTRASNSELVEALLEPERTLNRRLRRRNRRVPHDQRNNPPQHPRIVYPSILDINHFRHFLDILRNYDPMDDEPMWAADRVVAPTTGSIITIPETTNEFAIIGNHLTLVKGNQFGGRTKTDPHKHIHEFLGICDMLKYRDTENEAVCLMIRFFPPALFDRLLREIRAFSQNENESLTDAWLRMKEMLRNCHGHNLSKGNSNTDADKIMARMDAMTIKMDAQYKELQPRAKQPTPDLDNDDMPIIDVIDEILEEDFDALLDEGSKILHSIEGTLLEEEIFFELDEFMAMTANENSESDIEEPPFEKITINTDYKIKTSLEEPPMDLELKPLPDNLEYVFLEELSFLLVIISSKLSAQNKSKLVSILKKHKEAFAWKTTDIPGICPSFCKHKIQVLDDKKPVVQKQRRLNLNMQEVVKKEIV
ncbi:hypothetical protein Tco_0865800, partial [Tanacetum coccineum]